MVPNLGVLEGCKISLTLPDLVESFRELGDLPEGLKVDLCNEGGGGIANTLSQRKAVFHHNCRSLLHPTTLER